MRRFRIIALSGALAVLGVTVSAAPASAVVPVGEACTGSSGGGTCVVLKDDLMGTCQAIGINALWFRNYGFVKDIELYSAAGCAATALVDIIAPGSFKNTAGTATHYKVVW